MARMRAGSAAQAGRRWGSVPLAPERAGCDRSPAGRGPWTLVLDESHHLLELWGRLLQAVIEQLRLHVAGLLDLPGSPDRPRPPGWPSAAWSPGTSRPLSSTTPCPPR